MRRPMVTGAPEPRNETTLDTRLSVLDTRVANIDASYDRLSGQLETLGKDLKSLNAKFDEQAENYAKARATNWLSVMATGASVVAVVVTVLGTIGWLAISPTIAGQAATVADLRRFEETYARQSYTSENLALIRERVGKLETLAADLSRDKLGEREHTASVVNIEKNVDTLKTNINKAVDNKLNVDAFEAFKSSIKDTTSALKEDLIRSSDEISHQVHSLESEIVSRPENEAQWNSFNLRINDLVSRMEAASARINVIAPPTAAR